MSADSMLKAWGQLVEPAVTGEYEHLPPERRPVAEAEFFEEEEPTKPYGHDGPPTVEHRHSYTGVECLNCDECGKPAVVACETCWRAVCQKHRESSNAS